jgi:hypothetical protein
VSSYCYTPPVTTGGDPDRGDDDGFFKKERYTSQRDDSERAGDEVLSLLAFLVHKHKY